MDNKEYKEYTAADFLNDPDFLLWCLDPDKREDLFWSEFPANHPETFAEFRKAIQTVGSVRLNNFTLEEGEKAELYDSIMSDYRALCSRRREWSFRPCWACSAPRRRPTPLRPGPPRSG